MSVVQMFHHVLSSLVPRRKKPTILEDASFINFPGPAQVISSEAALSTMSKRPTITTRAQQAKHPKLEPKVIDLTKSSTSRSYKQSPVPPEKIVVKTEPSPPPAEEEKVQGLPGVRTYESGDQYASRKELQNMPWDQKKSLSNRQWNVRVRLCPDGASPDIMEDAIAFLLNHLQSWTTPTFIYVGPVYVYPEQAKDPYFKVIVGLQFTSPTTFRSILDHLGAMEDKPSNLESYNVFPSPGAPFSGLLAPFGPRDTYREIVKTGPLMVRGEPKAFSCVHIPSALGLPFASSSSDTTQADDPKHPRSTDGTYTF